ncbi:MAG: glucosamine-6-phosphate deaminase [Thermoanaerobacteraceae bacterium]
MDIRIFKDAEELGKAAAQLSEKIINKAIQEKGYARIVLSTGLSQITLLNNLIKAKIDWNKVIMFHLDEYIGIDENHPASFRRYLKEKFVNKVTLKEVYFVKGENDINQQIAELSKAIKKEPIDLGFIGIGENGHIGFNDPPANFETKDSFIVVNLDNRCKQQQVNEGWFENIEDVPKQAITMSVYQILQCKTIISCVPYKVKAESIKNVIENDVTPIIPATILKSHDDFYLFLDEDSASLLDRKKIDQHI